MSTYRHQRLSVTSVRRHHCCLADWDVFRMRDTVMGCQLFVAEIESGTVLELAHPRGKESLVEPGRITDEIRAQLHQRTRKCSQI